MTEREPDFEDDKLRIWKEPANSTERLGLDETVMDVNFETEEIYESRVYPLLPHPATMILLAERLASARHSPSQKDFALLLIGFAAADSSLKVLSKRNRSDGRITSQVTVVNDFGRVLIERHDLPDDDAYRGKVGELEDLLGPALLGDPTIVTATEWQEYNQEREK